MMRTAAFLLLGLLLGYAVGRTSSLPLVLVVQQFPAAKGPLRSAPLADICCVPRSALPPTT